MTPPKTPFRREPLWYKDAVIYEVHVRAFCDSNGDGIGDFPGLTGKLDYLTDLGISALWLLPFYPSPLKDDGYDIADYREVHPDYGTLPDFRRFLEEAHRRGLQVITELVINHTSDRHPWFQRARRAKPGSVARDFYVWSDDPSRYGDARIIFKDFETSNWTWDEEAGAYYWHRFYRHQPDLNFENPRVKEAIFDTLDYWFDMGVDGMRLDAIPYLFEQEGTSCENLPETHRFLKDLRRHLDERHDNRMFLAEANQWPEDAVEYFGDGDECHMSFHFPIMPRLFMALRMEDRFPLVDIIDQTPEIPETCQWAIFLRNHDELTLEMVTDEDRDYMYRVYARDSRARINLGIRRRLAPLLDNDRRRIELLNGLLFALPGTPVLYYGDEIGMGDNIYLGDRNGVRTPMQWSPDRNAGFSRTNPQKLYLPVVVDAEYHFEAVNVEAQASNPSSLLWWIRRVVSLRQRHPAFSRGDLELLFPDNHRVLAFLRRHEDETILVVANLSRFVQHVELDLGEYAGAVPRELFGQNPFPAVGELPYLLTLGPHGFYWFALERREREVAAPAGGLPTVTTDGDWKRWGETAEEELAGALRRVLPTRRWFAGKGRPIRRVTVRESIPVAGEEEERYLFLLVEVDHGEGEPVVYQLPVAVATGDWARWALEEEGSRAVARVDATGGDLEGPDVALVDAMEDDRFRRLLLSLVARRRTVRGGAGVALVGSSATALGQELDGARPESKPMRADQSNTSFVTGDRYVTKLYRRVEDGPHPDVEVGRFLARHGYERTPEVLGSLSLRRSDGGAATLASVQRYVPHEGDAWGHTLDALGSFVEAVLSAEGGLSSPPPAEGHLVDLAATEPPEEVADPLGFFLGSAGLLGRCVGELHRTLASDTEEPDFAPAPMSSHDRRALYQSMRSLAGRVLRDLERCLGDLSEPARTDGRQVIELRSDLFERLGAVTESSTGSRRIRVHGDLHLGQVLFTGDDFVIIDFEGEPNRSLSARRLKVSPLRDVAGMIRSFSYAAEVGLRRERERGYLGDDGAEEVHRWIEVWRRWCSALFLGAYLDAIEGTELVPGKPESLRPLLDAFLLEKAIYEVGYELGHRPEWVGIPLRAVVEALESSEGAA